MRISGRPIQAGITEIHINTEVRLAWRRGLEGAFARDADQIVPYKLLQAADVGLHLESGGRPFCASPDPRASIRSPPASPKKLLPCSCPIRGGNLILSSLLPPSKAAASLEIPSTRAFGVLGVEAAALQRILILPCAPRPGGLRGLNNMRPCDSQECRSLPGVRCCGGDGARRPKSDPGPTERREF